MDFIILIVFRHIFSRFDKCRFHNNYRSNTRPNKLQQSEKLIFCPHIVRSGGRCIPWALSAKCTATVFDGDNLKPFLTDNAVEANIFSPCFLSKNVSSALSLRIIIYL